MSKPVILCILDGWGHREDREGNAPALANTPNFDRIMAETPTARLITHGPDAGLPSGQMGNSEVGHTNIGAGRVVAMDLGQIDLAIENGSFFENAALIEFAQTLKTTGGTAHLMGLVSPGGVHSHQDHLISAAKALTRQGVPVAVHLITDGRDVPPKSARVDLMPVTEALRGLNARLATVVGRYFAMDRDNRWERVAQAFAAMVQAEGTRADTWDAAIDLAYNRGETDEFITPTVLSGHHGIDTGDGVFFLNFRADRAREILSAIADPGFTAFDTGARPELAACLGMVDYSEAHNAFMTSAFQSRPSSTLWALGSVRRG